MELLPRIILVFLISSTGYAQMPAGIYVINKTSKRSLCEQEIKMFFGKTKLCISEKPILGMEEIEYVSDILYSATLKINYISIGLSQHSVIILNKIYASMPGYQLALVVEGRAIGQFALDQEVKNRSLNIGHDLDLNRIKFVQEKLKKSVPKNNK